jgi:hypothetical protein
MGGRYNMGHGTMVKMYASRIHRCNAEQVVQEAIEIQEHIERILIAMAASRGEVVDGCMWYEHVARAVPNLLEEYADACFRRSLATEIIENPEDADDDYDEEIGSDATEGGVEG